MKEEMSEGEQRQPRKKKQKEELKEGSKAPFIAPKGASAKVNSSMTLSKKHCITMFLNIVL